MASALDNVKVVDLTRTLAGPFCTMHLGDMGADVIKVEEPETGDETRGWTPFWNGVGSHFLSFNRNKRSLALNLKKKEGVEIVLGLAAKADVMVESFRTGALDRMGLGYEAVRRVNSRIVYCSISGYGQKGPMAGKAAYDGAIQAASGMMSVTGTPDSGPLRVGYMSVDIPTGLTAAFAIASALFRRGHTGMGQHLDVAMLDCAMTLLNPNIARYLMTGLTTERMGNASPTNQGTGDTWATKDGHIQMTVITDAMTAKMCAAFERADLAKDPRFATTEGRVEYKAEIKLIIGEILATKTTAEWIASLGPAGVPVAPVHSIEQLMAFPQLDHRGVMMTMPAPPGMDGEIKAVGAGFHASNGEPEGRSPGPLLGQHTNEVLTEIGFDDSAIKSFHENGVI